MKQAIKFFAPAACLLAIGCGGTHSASITFPFVRVFNGIEGFPSVAVQFHDLSANLLATSPQVLLGAANALPDSNFVYTLGTATVLDNNGNPLFAGASVQYAQNNKYTVVACGGSATYETVVLTDSEVAGPAGTASVPGGTAPKIAGLKYATIPAAANGAGVDGNGYLAMADGGATTFSVIFTASGSTTPLFPAQAVTVADGAYYTDVMYDTATAGVQSATL